MNLIVIEPGDLDVAGSRAHLTGRRAQHISAVHRATVGDTLRVGLLNGRLGTGQVREVSADHVTLDVDLNHDPPPSLPVVLLLALPRPKVARRIIQATATMGVKHLVLMNSARVEKSYWASPYLDPAALREQLVLGLEQGGDTVLPRIDLKRRLRPFIEDELNEVAGPGVRLIAHPEGKRECPRGLAEPVTLAIGPEGGFTPFEVELLARHGFEPVTLGARRLRVEQAVPALLARLF